jgi:hypothetical protein
VAAVAVSAVNVTCDFFQEELDGIDLLPNALPHPSHNGPATTPLPASTVEAAWRRVDRTFHQHLVARSRSQADAFECSWITYTVTRDT